MLSQYTPFLPFRSQAFLGVGRIGGVSCKFKELSTPREILIAPTGRAQIASSQTKSSTQTTIQWPPASTNARSLATQLLVLSMGPNAVRMSGSKFPRLRVLSSSRRRVRRCQRCGDEPGNRSGLGLFHGLFRRPRAHVRCWQPIAGAQVSCLCDQWSDKYVPSITRGTEI